QWFLKYPCVKESADAVANGEITFRPARWSKTYSHWLDNIQDWCISRQLWWGHQIPVWYRKDSVDTLQGAESLDVSDMKAGDIYVGAEPPTDPENWVRDEDVMDTWFSSWLWPFATMNEAERGKFYPTADLVTGPDILFFWVARMIMASHRFQEELPFKNVFFTSIIRDSQGRKMSKSLGNSPDPIDLMDEYGADGLRFGLLRTAPIGSDVKFDEQLVAEGRNFANKIYNACRFRQMASGEDTVNSVKPFSEISGLRPYHYDVARKLDGLAVNLEKSYADYKFNEVGQQLYDFLWGEFCDKFLEAVKGDLRDSATAEARETTLAVFDAVMSRYLQLLHPYMPHITEELSARMGYVAKGEFLMQKVYPEDTLSPEGEAEAAKSDHIYATAGKMRNLKAEYNVASRKDVKFIIIKSSDWLADEADVLGLLAGGEISIEESYDAPKGTPAAISEVGEIYMPLEGLIDVEAERSRLDKEISKIEKEVKKCEGKLGNKAFTDKAPVELVDREKARRDEWAQKLSQLQEMRASLI
ncbi:class I tRNA ligase family protein, partial [Akkermansiaceae bacterium]|nr:class I tRNA ligase family protein [Akkermansiaceae bacterium]